MGRWLRRYELHVQQNNNNDSSATEGTHHLGQKDNLRQQPVWTVPLATEPKFLSCFNNVKKLRTMEKHTSSHARWR